MTDITYQGWTNRATWAVNLGLTNERSTAEMLYHFANSDDYQEWERADALRDYVEESNPLIDDCSLWADLMNTALWEVNWQEIIDFKREEN